MLWLFLILSVILLHPFSFWLLKFLALIILALFIFGPYYFGPYYLALMAVALIIWPFWRATDRDKPRGVYNKITHPSKRHAMTGTY